MILTADVSYVSYVSEHILHGFLLLTLCLQLIACSLLYFAIFVAVHGENVA